MQNIFFVIKVPETLLEILSVFGAIVSSVLRQSYEATASKLSNSETC